jgi:hypothetical protein
MNVDRGIRRLLVLVSALVALAVVVLQIGTSSPRVVCAFLAVREDGTFVSIRAPIGFTGEQIQAEGRRLYPTDKKPLLVVAPATGTLSPIPPPPDVAAIPETCDPESIPSRLARHSAEIGRGLPVVAALLAVLWGAFFALRWVVRGFAI